ncbi:enoyl-CoA hydratase/carnithine racemase [Kineococcus xinjiangensis]|uniref:Enoyl-CoA hydratase/carnithine racemase n=1 Tax=Kineococcus xinjiangensis TaxID=512762 RepID=A0A2S6IK24_9ACTN|nr:enoyl-CoA hydratase-related protein [Kineococcus xinjiangensis]PPK94583.1 enoyl-CoA hydratase/carnithine racemase [Kineococcus xinjiangensis]
MTSVEGRQVDGTKVDSTPASASVAEDGAVAVLTLDRQARRNALDLPAAAELARALDGLAESVAAGRIRAVVVTGAGGSFCAGRDIAGVDPAAEDAGQVLADVFNPLVRRIADLPVPTLAAVEGPALGVGLGLALACDLVVAAEDAKLGSPFGRIGAVLDSGAHLLMAERIGRPRTLELVYTGRLLDGAQAAAWGLVSRAVAPGSALAEALTTARALAQGPTRAFAASKHLLARIRDEALPLAEVLSLEAAVQRELSAGADYREGFAAFQQKRSPVFRGA